MGLNPNLKPPNVGGAPQQVPVGGPAPGNQNYPIPGMQNVGAHMMNMYNKNPNYPTGPQPGQWGQGR